MSADALPDVVRCGECGRPMPNQPPIRRCSDCGQLIRRHDKYHWIERDGMSTIVHRHCDRPESYR